MTESKPWRPNILLYYAESSRYSQAKFQDSLTLPFEQVLPEAVIQKIKEQGYHRDTLYTDCDLMGMDVTGALTKV